MKKPTINIVATCTDRKTQAVSAICRFRKINRLSLEDRVMQWERRLQKADCWPASSLYAGDHWQVASKFGVQPALKDYSIVLWIVSAGYGLLQADADVAPYSATFTSGHPDDVLARGDSEDRPDRAREWWRAVGARSFGQGRAPRSLKAVAKRDPSAYFLVIASRSYLSAIESDLVACRKMLKKPGQLSIASASAGRFENELTRNVVPVDARLQHALNGARQALNARAADYALTTVVKKGLPPTFEYLSSELKRLLEKQPRLVQYNREQMENEQVSAFIEKELQKDPNLKHSVLLRRLRDSGKACEQKRFAGLFAEKLAERIDA